jgi:hypothetical protein
MFCGCKTAQIMLTTKGDGEPGELSVVTRIRRLLTVFDPRQGWNFFFATTTVPVLVHAAKA